MNAAVIPPDFKMPAGYHRTFLFLAGSFRHCITAADGMIDARSFGRCPYENNGDCLDFIQDSIETVRRECEAA